ncbi:MAG TPA: two-component regulator propeller domain-containing protein, partial [Thermoanaerobaculia bacterium]|nr:two-component regulator propeller domain-containing protein [Thermoanaerobaculia bacterium]
MHFTTPTVKIGATLIAGSRLPRALAYGAVAALVLASSPALSLDAKTPLAQLGHDAWPDALPQNSVSAILQTRDGYLWLGTYEGLVRWSGVEFRVYDRRDTPNLSSNSVVALAEDGAGRLFVGTMGGGLVRREKGAFHALTSKQGLPSDSVFALAVRGDSVWAGTGN